MIKNLKTKRDLKLKKNKKNPNQNLKRKRNAQRNPKQEVTEMIGVKTMINMIMKTLSKK